MDNRSTSLVRKRTPLGPYRRLMPRVLGGLEGGGRFLMSEVPLHARAFRKARLLLGEDALQGLLEIMDTHRPRVLQ